MTGLLSDIDLWHALASGELVIDGLDQRRIGPASVDLVLAREFLQYRPEAQAEYGFVNPSVQQNLMEPVVLAPDGVITLEPGEFLLGSTQEMVALGGGLAARLEGKSSLGRLGVGVHATAGFIDPGFAGTITLELSNVSPMPVMLYVGMAIAQLAVFKLSSPTTAPYNLDQRSHYAGQAGPVPSRSWQRWRLW